MGVFNKTPYTNFHELNLNWIIKKIKEVAADNTFLKQFFKTIEDEHILGVVTDVTENNDNTVKIDYWNEDTQLMDDYTVYNKTGTDGAISGAVTPIANRVTTAEGDISTLQGQMTNAIQPYNNETNFATDLNALPLKAVFVRIGPETLNSPLPSNQGYCLSIRSSANCGSQMAQTNNSEIVWVRRCQNGTWSDWQQLLTRTDPVKLISQLGLSTTATSIYSGDWTKYRMLLIEGTQYSNMRNSIIVTTSYFDSTTNDNRVQLPVPATLDDSPSLVWYSIYKTDNTHITVAATSSKSALGIKIYGIM